MRSLEAKKKLDIRVESKLFLRPDTKPAKFRVWLEYWCDSAKDSVQSHFAEINEICFENGESGVVNDEYTIGVDVPEIVDLNDGESVKLNVGLVRSSVDYPSVMSDTDLIASAVREFTYRK